MRKVFFVLGTLTDADMDWLVGVGSRASCEAGALLIKQGKAVDALYIVLGGQLVVTIETPQVRELARLGSGEIIGELSFLDSRPPSATVKALERSTVLSIPRAKLSSKLQQDLEFASRFYHALGILLAHRMRNNVSYFSGASLSDEVVYDDELDPEMLDSVDRASARFDWLLKRTSGG
jgi:bacteriocin-type transport-associated protein